MSVSSLTHSRLMSGVTVVSSTLTPLSPSSTVPQHEAKSVLDTSNEHTTFDLGGAIVSFYWMLLVLLAVITPMLLVIIVSLVMRYCRSKNNSKNCATNYAINYDEKTLPEVNLRIKCSSPIYSRQQQHQQQLQQQQSPNCNSETIELYHRSNEVPLTHGNLMQGNCDIRPFCSGTNSMSVLSVHNLHQHQQQQQQKQSELTGQRDALHSSSGYFPYATSNPLIRAPCQHSSPTIRKSGR